MVIQGGERVFKGWLLIWTWIVIKRGMSNVVLVWIEMA
jgi:hypothetical protein